MSAVKYPSIFSCQMATVVYIFPNFQNYVRCEKDLKDNKDKSLHLGRNMLGYLSLTLSVPRSSQFSSSFALGKLFASRKR